MSYKSAIIGTGKIAGLFDHLSKTNGVYSHAKACRQTTNIDLKAACDSNPERLNRFCRLWKINTKYTHINQLLDHGRFDVISLCVPTKIHFKLIKTILEHPHRPKVLLVEKPICLEKDELRRIQQLLKKTKGKLIVNHHYRFNQGLQKVSDLIQRRTLGDTLAIRGVYYCGLMNNGVHLIDMLRMILDSDLKIVQARKGAIGRLHDPCVDVELKAARFSKTQIVLESVEEKYYQIFEMEIRLEKGRIRIMDFGKEIYIDKAVKNRLGEVELKNIEKIKTPKDRHPFRCIFEGIAKYLENGDQTMIRSVGIEETRKTMNTLWQIIEKALKNERKISH